MLMLPWLCYEQLLYMYYLPKANHLPSCTRYAYAKDWSHIHLGTLKSTRGSQLLYENLTI
jgi:hypothetical protein